MKKVFLFASVTLAATMMISSCNKKDSSAPLPDDDPVAVQFSSNIGGITPIPRPAAAGTTWASNDAIGVFMVNHGTSTMRGDATNKRYITSAGNGTFAPDAAANTVYYPTNGDKVDFIAYHPYTSSIVSLGNYSVNVATQTTPADIDLLYAKATNSGSGYDKTNTSAVALAFSHKLCKLTLNTSVAPEATQITAADLNTMTVTIVGMNTQAPFNLATGTLGTASNVAAITPRTATAGQQYEAILLPATFTGVSVTFGVTAGSSPGDYLWNIPADTFEEGKEYVYSISFTGPKAIAVTGTINDWVVENKPEHDF
jgi:hypothetical protein